MIAICMFNNIGLFLNNWFDVVNDLSCFLFNEKLKCKVGNHWDEHFEYPLGNEIASYCN